MKIKPTKVIKLIKKYYPTFNITESKKLIDFCTLRVIFHRNGYGQVELKTWPEFVRFSEGQYNHEDIYDYDRLEKMMDYLSNNFGFAIIKSELVYENTSEATHRPKGNNG